MIWKAVRSRRRASVLPGELCSGTGFASGNGSVCFWASWTRIQIRNLFVQFRSRLRFRARILPSRSKIIKTLYFYCFVTSLWLLSFKNDVSYLQKRISIKTYREKFNFFSWHLKGHWRKEQDPEPDPDLDPLVKGTDPEHFMRDRSILMELKNHSLINCGSPDPNSIHRYGPESLVLPLKVTFDCEHIIKTRL